MPETEFEFDQAEWGPVTGTVASPLKLKTTKTTSFAEFRLLSRRPGKGGTVRDVYIDFSLWHDLRDQAIAAKLGEGQRVRVSGSLTSWISDRDRAFPQLNVDQFEILKEEKEPPSVDDLPAEDIPF